MREIKNFNIKYENFNFSLIMRIFQIINSYKNYFFKLIIMDDQQILAIIY